MATDSRLISRKPSAALVGTSVCRNMHIEEPRGTFRHQCHHLGIVSDTVDLDQIPPDHHHHHHVHHHHRVRSVVSCYRNPCPINGTTVSTQSKTQFCVLVNHHNRRVVYHHDQRNPYPTGGESWISLDFTCFSIIIVVIVIIIGIVILKSCLDFY